MSQSTVRGSVTTAYKVIGRIQGGGVVTRTVTAETRTKAIETAWTSLFLDLPEDTVISARVEPMPNEPWTDDDFNATLVRFLPREAIS